MKRASCLSVHSVKGGVGKSTFATLAAIELAKLSGRRTWLIDMDLTGTSLADVLPLRAPACANGSEGWLDLKVAPDAFHDVTKTRSLISDRGAQTTRNPIGVPFLNDFLLHASADWEPGDDLLPEALAWSYDGGPANLRILPSSALPNDLDRILPLIFDEERSAFIEARLEWLLAELLDADDDINVVFDTPPTIPGLSRSVLSLAHRLTSQPKKQLSDDEGMPDTLLNATMVWRAFIVSTLDHQDIRAVARWLDRIPSEPKPPIVQIVINKIERTDTAAALMESILTGTALQIEENLVAPPAPPSLDALHPLLQSPRFVAHTSAFEIFRKQATPQDDGTVKQLLDGWPGLQ